MGNTTFFRAAAKRWQITPFSLVLLLCAMLLAFDLSALLTACTSGATRQAEAVATAIPVPGANVVQTIRTRVASAVKAEVQKHPATAPYVNGLAQACFQVAGLDLPSPGVLQSLFGLASAFAPADIAAPVSAVLKLYAQDEPLVATVQGGSKAYFTALGLGIQDGVKAAAVSEAP